VLQCVAVCCSVLQCVAVAEEAGDDIEAEAGGDGFDVFVERE